MLDNFVLWKSPIQVDTKKLSDWYEELRITEPVVKTYDDRFGFRVFDIGTEIYGWSLHRLCFSEEEVTLYSGDYEDLNYPILRNKAMIAENGVTRQTQDSDFVVKTENCFGYGEEILDFFSGCYRGTVLGAKPGSVINRYREGGNSQDWKVFVVIETNPNAVCYEGNKELDIGVDGSLWFWNGINYGYNIANRGITDDVTFSFKISLLDFEKYYNMGKTVI